MSDNKPIDLPIDLTQDIPEMTAEGLDLDQAWDYGEDVVFDDDPAEAAMVAEEENTLPPERVRFTAPMVLRRDAGDTVDGALLNLSVRGVAAIAPAEARPGDRVWIQFRLYLAEDPISLLCEVIWCTPQDDDDWAYGLRFASMTLEEERRVRAVVNERSEGRAGEWPLPVMPESVGVAAKPTSPWLSAAAGMAAGIGLALALSVIPNASVGSIPAHAETRPSALEEAPAAVVAAEAAPKAEPVVAEPVAAMPVSIPDPVDVEPPPQPRVAAEAPKPAPSPDLLPRKLGMGGPAEPDGDVLTPLGTPGGVELALLTDGSVADHVSFWLDEPKRLVVDIYGRKSGFSRNAYRVDHPLASQLRVGQHSGKVRFVIETADDVSSQVRTRAAGKALVVELRRK